MTQQINGKKSCVINSLTIIAGRPAVAAAVGGGCSLDHASSRGGRSLIDEWSGIDCCVVAFAAL